MRLPELTALQFATLSLLFSGEKTARELHQQLHKWDGPRTAAAFSQLIGRLRKATLIDGMRQGQAGQRFSECCYRVTDLGVIVWKSARQFYAAFDPPPPNLQPVMAKISSSVSQPACRRMAAARNHLFGRGRFGAVWASVGSVKDGAAAGGGLRAALRLFRLIGRVLP